MFRTVDQETLQLMLRRRTHPLKYENFNDEFAPPPGREALKYAKDEHDFKSFEDRTKDKASRILFKNTSGSKRRNRESSRGEEVERPTQRGRFIEGSFENGPIEMPGVDRDQPDLPEGLFTTHANFCFLGPTRSGKTTACINLVAQYLRHKAFTDLKIVSPTYESNPEFKLLFQYLKIPEEQMDMHVCDNANDAMGFLTNAVEEFRDKGEEWEHAKLYKKAYKKYLAGNRLTTSELFMLQATSFSPPPKDMRKPSMAIIVDDMTHTALLSRHNGAYGHILIKHRHLGGKNIGASFFTLVHNYKTGIPKMARQNIHIYNMFPMADETQLKVIWEETTGGSVSYDEFVRLYREAISADESGDTFRQSHNFFVVDVYNPDVMKRFRRNFNQYLIPRIEDEEKEEEKEN